MTTGTCLTSPSPDQDKVHIIQPKQFCCNNIILAQDTISQQMKTHCPRCSRYRWQNCPSGSSMPASMWMRFLCFFLQYWYLSWWMPGDTLSLKYIPRIRTQALVSLARFSLFGNLQLGLSPVWSVQAFSHRPHIHTSVLLESRPSWRTRIAGVHVIGEPCDCEWVISTQAWASSVSAHLQRCTVIWKEKNRLVIMGVAR